MKPGLHLCGLIAIAVFARAEGAAEKGKIAILDQRNSIVAEVTIQNGRFASVGRGNQKLNTCTKVIDLRGRTAVPGLIDNHNHIVLLGMRPGHDIRLETAFSIADVQSMIRARVKSVPAEKRLPTLAELDAAAPDNPVLINWGRRDCH